MRRQHRGFVFIEGLIAMLVMLALGGMLVALAISFFTGPLPWYAWTAAALLLPSCLIGLIVLGDRPPGKSRRD